MRKILLRGEVIYSSNLQSQSMLISFVGISTQINILENRRRAGRDRKQEHAQAYSLCMKLQL